MCRLLRRHFKLRGLLEGESVGSLGQGGYNPFCADPADSGASASTLWELAPLMRHYNSHVAQCAGVVAAMPPDGSSGSLAGVINTAALPHELAVTFQELHRGCFDPAVPAASSSRKRGRAQQARRGGGAPLSLQLAQLLDAYVAGGPADSLQEPGRFRQAAKAGGADTATVMQTCKCNSAELSAAFRCAFQFHIVPWCMQLHAE